MSNYKHSPALERAFWNALNVASILLSADHIGESKCAIRLSSGVRDNVIRLAKDCQRELGCLDSMIYGSFEGVQAWESEKVLAELSPLGECSECDDGYNYELDALGKELSLICGYCDLAEEWEDEIESFKEFYEVDAQYSGSARLGIINHPDIDPELKRQLLEAVKVAPDADEWDLEIILAEPDDTDAGGVGC